MTSMPEVCCGGDYASPTCDKPATITVYEKWVQELRDEQKQEQLHGRTSASSRRNASVQSSRRSKSSGTEASSASRVSSVMEATRYAAPVGEVDPAHLIPQQRIIDSSSHHASSRASSTFKHKLSMKLACVTCVVGVPKGTKHKPEESREDDVYEDLFPGRTSNGEGILDHFHCATREECSDRIAREDPSVPSRKQPSVTSSSTKATESRARSRGRGEHEDLENCECEENRLLAVLEDVEHWLGIHQDNSSSKSHSVFACSN